MYLAPQDPSSSIPNSSSMTPNPRMMLRICENGFKMRKLNDDDVEKDNASLQMEEASNIAHAHANKLLVMSRPEEAALVPRTTNPNTEKGTQKVSAKEQLYKLCGVRHWKAPVYEFCDQDGPGNTRLFIVKARVEVKEEDSRITVLECFGDPQNKKKIAAEQAAEAALWFLKNVGHTLQTDKASGRESRQNRFRR